MRPIVRIIPILLLGLILVFIPLYSFSQKNAAGFINQARSYLIQGDKEKAVSALDNAFNAANSAGDAEALMEIGDLYISADKSLRDKAMEAWSQAGRWKCKPRQ